MMKILPVLLFAITFQVIAQPSPGIWTGSATGDFGELEMILNLNNSGGKWSASVDIPQIGKYGKKLKMKVNGESIELSGFGIIKGDIASNELKGSWTDKGITADLAMTHHPELKWYTHTRREVEFISEGLTLSGTVFLPEGASNVPGVVVIHGSGPEKRDNFHIIAGFLSRYGIAVLVYDKRGTGRSEGDPEYWKRFFFDELAADASAAVDHLAGMKETDNGKIGFMGYSQGGWIAPLAATKNEKVRFLILMSASVTTVAEDRLFERAARLTREGFTAEEVAEATEMQVVDQELTRSGSNFAEYSALWEENESKRWFRRVYLSESPWPADHSYRVWYRKHLDYDPVRDIADIDVPMLGIFGDADLDRFGPVAESVRNLENLAKTAYAFKGFNHNLRKEEEYNKSPWKNHDAPYYVRILDWLMRQGIL